MFAPIHVHSSTGSLLDSTCRIKELAKRAKELGMTACAITDHGNMFGVVDFYKACKAQGLKPVIGCEVYTAARTMHDRDAAFDKKSGHLILLAENQEGYKNLVKIVSESYTEGFYYKPRVDYDLLRKNSKGIICLSGCLAGKTQHLLLAGDYEGAKKEALLLLSIFGEGNFFLEIQNHGLEDDIPVIEGLKKLSKDISVPLVATNDTHYIYREDAKVQDLLMCVQTQAKVTDENRMRFETDEFYLKSEEEMLSLFPDIPDAVERTQEIADRCHVEFEFGHYHLPEYTPPEGKTCEEYLRELCLEGLEKRYGKEALSQDSEYRMRLESELSTIKDMGFIEYFLIVWDFINFAKTNGIPVGPGRGCCNASTLIKTKTGHIPINKVKKGMYVLTHEGRFREVLATFKFPVKETLYQICCGDTGKGNAFTGDHKIYACREIGEQPEWIPANCLNRGDYVIKPTNDNLIYRKISEIKRINNEKFVYDINVQEDHSYVTNSFAAHNSAAGSIVSYCLAITELDPIKYSLVFERFLNPERVSMPDIDIDFCIERRQKVIDYVTEKYGHDKVSGIITFNTLKAKAAVRDVARALGATYQEGDQIAKAIPDVKDIDIATALTLNPELKARYEKEPLVRQVLDYARALEGLPRHASKHAAGVVISKDPLEDYTPLYASDKGIAVQFNMTTIEELGHLKMDFLGLRNLTVIDDALRMIKENHGIDIDWSKIGLDDPEVYKLISSGNTAGVFQLESSGMTDFLKQLRPDCFEDIIAGIALYRPGPMDSIPKYLENKRNPDKITYVDKALAPILDVTYGCLIYQEEVMQIVRDLAGYSYGRSDLVRRAMSKKKADVMQKEREYFIYGKKADDGSVEISGCIANGISEEAANAIFDDMVTFAEYAFNKSHAAAYAVISYQTAYLKAHYPAEFLAALMTSVSGKADQISLYIRNAKDMGIEVLPPSVMTSYGNFTASKDGKIRFGLLGIKNVGEGPVKAITETRDKIPSNAGFYRFLKELPAGAVNKKAVESLIAAGAFDCISSNRAQLMAATEDAVKTAQKVSKINNANQINIFELGELETEIIDEPELPNVADFSKDEKLALEKEMLGVYVTGHPLDAFEKVIRGFTETTTADINPGFAEQDSDSVITSKFREGDTVTVAGMIMQVKTMFTKKSQEMARFTLEDFLGTINCIAFPKLFERKRSLIKDDSIVAVKGKVSSDGGSPELLLNDILDLSNEEYIRQAYARKPSEPACLKLRVVASTYIKYGGVSNLLQKIEEYVNEHPGDIPVRVYLPGGRCITRDSSRGISSSMMTILELRELLGDENVKQERQR